MPEPAIYNVAEGGVFATYAIGVANMRDSPLYVALASNHIQPKVKHKHVPVSTMVTWNDKQEHLAILSTDMSRNSRPSKSGELFNIYGDPQLVEAERKSTIKSDLYGINNIAVAALTPETRDDIFRRIAEAANFVPEYRYDGMDAIVRIAFDEFLAQYRKGDWQQLQDETNFERFYTESLWELRELEVFRRIRIQSGLDEGTNGHH